MYIRTKKVNKTQRTVVQLAESFRDNGKTKQRIIRHVGTAHSEEELEALLKIAESIKIQLEHENLKKDVKLTRASYASKIGKIKKSNEDVLIPITHLQEQARHILGIHDIYGFVYKQIGFTNPFLVLINGNRFKFIKRDRFGSYRQSSKQARQRCAITRTIWSFFKFRSCLSDDG